MTKTELTSFRDFGGFSMTCSCPYSMSVLHSMLQVPKIALALAILIYLNMYVWGYLSHDVTALEK